MRPFHPELKEIIIICKTIADKLNNHFISSNHFLLAIMEHKENLSARILIKCGLTEKQVEDIRHDLFEKEQRPLSNIPLTKELERALKSSSKYAQACGSEIVCIEHVFLNLLHNKNSLLHKNLSPSNIHFDSFIQMLESEGIKFNKRKLKFKWFNFFFR